jgi:hypothetical protein
LEYVDATRRKAWALSISASRDHTAVATPDELTTTCGSYAFDEPELRLTGLVQPPFTKRED